MRWLRLFCRASASASGSRRRRPSRYPERNALPQTAAGYDLFGVI